VSGSFLPPQSKHFTSTARSFLFLSRSRGPSVVSDEVVTGARMVSTLSSSSSQKLVATGWDVLTVVAGLGNGWP